MFVELQELRIYTLEVLQKIKEIRYTDFSWHSGFYSNIQRFTFLSDQISLYIHLSDHMQISLITLCSFLDSSFPNAIS